MPDQSRPLGAVFLSYAKQDAEAASRLCTALRAAGIEVWFDQHELVGGDAWDAKIKKQIRECALFLPVISAQTNARTEGYFRREWNLATQRQLDIAHDAAFLVPVVIDGTRDGEARVPEEFLRIQWTRLPGGEAPPAFCDRVRNLLHGEPMPAAPGRGASSAPPLPAGRRRPAMARNAVFAAIAVAILSCGYFLATRPAAPGTAAGAGSNPPTTEKSIVTAPARVPDAKSIAVLPFADMSAAKDQEYMSEGLAEELLNLLAKIPALQVTSRSSAFSFKDKNLEIPAIAKQLNVAHVLEGSVRKSGNRLRITAQLIDARTDTHLWSETYDRTLDDIFAVQDEIAGAVVRQLKITLLGAGPTMKAPDPKAYALFLHARQLNRAGTPESWKQSIALYQQALALDPDFAAAWEGLARNYTSQASYSLRPVDEGYRLAREAVDKALTLDPANALAHANLGWIVATYDGDLATAARHYEQALALEPGNPDIIRNAATMARNLGHIDTAITLQEYAVDHDPLNPGMHFNLADSYLCAGRFDEAIVRCRTSLSLNPESIGRHHRIGVALLLKGEPAAALEEMRKEPAEDWRLIGLAMIHHTLNQKAQSDAALAGLIAKFEKDSAYNIAYVLAWRREAERAFEWLDKAVAYHDTGLSEIAVQPLLANLRQDPRWLPFLRKLGKAPEQVATIKFDVKAPSR